MTNENHPLRVLLRAARDTGGPLAVPQSAAAKAVDCHQSVFWGAEAPSPNKNIGPDLIVALRGWVWERLMQADGPGRIAYARRLMAAAGYKTPSACRAAVGVKLTRPIPAIYCERVARVWAQAVLDATVLFRQNAGPYAD